MQTCIGSDNRLSQKERNRELDGRGDETICIGSKNVKLTESNVNVMSICGSTYCLSERRSMELCFVELELDLIACLNFSCFCVFHSMLAAFYYETTLGSVFWISNRPEDCFKIP